MQSAEDIDVAVVADEGQGFRMNLLYRGWGPLILRNDMDIRFAL